MKTNPFLTTNIDPPGLSFFDQDDPLSLVNILPGVVAQRVQQLRDSPKGYLLNLDETALYRELQLAGFNPKAVDNLLRVKFWTEYERAVGCGEPVMRVSSIIGRTISRETFYKFYITDYLRFSWMLCPPINYTESLHETLLVGVQKLRNFMDNVDLSKDTAISARKLGQFLTVFRLIEERLYGVKISPGRVPYIPKTPVSAEDKKVIDELVMDNIEEKLKRAKDRVAALQDATKPKGNPSEPQKTE